MLFGKSLSFDKVCLSIAKVQRYLGHVSNFLFTERMAPLKVLGLRS